MSKHTPGPLTVRHSPADPEDCTEPIWEIHADRVGYLGQAQTEEDARLWAAAPELLAACEALPTFDLVTPDAADFKDHARDFIRAMRMARAAIAKAKGES